MPRDWELKRKHKKYDTRDKRLEKREKRQGTTRDQSLGTKDQRLEPGNQGKRQKTTMDKGQETTRDRNYKRSGTRDDQVQVSTKGDQG